VRTNSTSEPQRQVSPELLLQHFKADAAAQQEQRIITLAYASQLEGELMAARALADRALGELSKEKRTKIMEEFGFAEGEVVK
jgi:hypothetical protein